MGKVIVPIEIVREERPKQKSFRPLSSRLRYSKNFHKTDRNLDQFIDSNKQLRQGEKLMLKKLLCLRTSDSTQKVNVTVMGLAKLLSIDPKTVRRHLKRLVEKGFLLPQTDTWSPGKNYPCKSFLFPQTFPGFDLSMVFIRKGDKQKRKLREEGRKAYTRRSRHTIAKIKAWNDECAAANNPSFCAKSTSPISSDLLDGSSSGGTWNNSEDTFVSSSLIPKLPNRSPAATGPASSSIEVVKRTTSEKLAKQLEGSFYFGPLEKEMDWLLDSYDVKNRKPYLARFFKRCMDQNRHFKTLEDRIVCAREFKAYMFGNMVRELDEKHLIIKTIKRFLRRFVDEFRTPSYEVSWDWVTPDVLWRWKINQAAKDREFLHACRN